MWFCYERSMTKWEPKIYLLGPPQKQIQDRKRSEVWEVPEDCKRKDGSGDFDKLIQRFVKPKG